MIKNCLFLFAGIFLTFLTACQQDNLNEIKPTSTEEPELNAPGITMVDPSSPENAHPYISDDKELKSAPGSGWTLVWSDEFNDASLNTDKWNVTVSSKARAARKKIGINDWWWKSDHVWLSNGTLVLKASKPDGNTMYCGSVDSKNKYEPKYGYMEARIKIADLNKGVHTAFWTQGHNQGNVDGSGADGCEIDIVETPWYNNHAQTVLHWDGYGDNTVASTKHWYPSSGNLHSGYHTFGMDWTESYLKIYYDGTLMWTYTGVGIPKVAEWLWVSVGASFGDGNYQDPGDLTYAYVDYVRVYERSNATYNFIKNKYTGKCLRPLDAGTSDNTQVVLYPQQDWNSMKWQLVDLNNGYCLIKNKYSGKCLRPYEAGNADNTNVVTYTENSDWSSEQWKIIDAGSGYVWIQNNYTGKYLRPYNSESADNTNLVTYAFNSSWNSEKWQLISTN